MRVGYFLDKAPLKRSNFQMNQVGMQVGYWLDKAPLKRSNSKMNQVGMQVGYFLDQAPVKRLEFPIDTDIVRLLLKYGGGCK